MRAVVGRHVVCHMMADSEEELEVMAVRIGLSARWRHGDHYDVPLPERAAAVAAGAIEVSSRDLVRLRRARRSGRGFFAG